MTLEQKEIDWFEGDVEQKRAEMRDKGIEFAQLYEIFVDSPRGQELLAYWERTKLDTSTPVESSLQRYAADESIRRFIRDIRTQIRLAQDRI